MSAQKPQNEDFPAQESSWVGTSIVSFSRT